MTKLGRLLVLLAGLAIAMSTLAGCSHARALEKQKAECQKSANESERNGCLKKVSDAERAYERKKNETRIEQNYKRKLEDMRPPGP